MLPNTQPASKPALILFGSPGSGKGTQAKLLRERLALPHISTGDMLRSRIGSGDSIGALIKSGKLVSDEVVNQLVRERLAQPDCRNGVILDGYPRTLKQARVLLEMLKRKGLTPVVVYLIVNHDEVVARLSGRRQCPVCGTIYSVTRTHTKISGVCDLDGTNLITRDDDRESVIRQRLQEYDSETRPILDFFRETGISMVGVEGGNATPEEIAERIGGALRASVAGVFAKRAETEPSPAIGP